MRSIKKIKPPDILVEKAITWTKEYHRAKKKKSLTDTQRTRYRQKDIKSRLLEETNNKCIYCESKLVHNTPGDVEHILPASKNERLIFCWHNLTIACTECNRRKNDYQDDGIPFLNPYSDNVEDRLVHAGPLVFHKAGDVEAEVSTKILELSKIGKRAQLFERKSEKLSQVTNMLDRLKTTTNPSLKNILRSEILELCNTESEFSGMIRTYINKQGILK